MPDFRISRQLVSNTGAVSTPVFFYERGLDRVAGEGRRDDVTEGRVSRSIYAGEGIGRDSE
jgi:hypothetical protein